MLLLVAVVTALITGAGVELARWIAQTADEDSRRGIVRLAAPFALAWFAAWLYFATAAPKGAFALSSAVGQAAAFAAVLAATWWAWVPDNRVWLRRSAAAIGIAASGVCVIHVLGWGGAIPQLADLSALWEADPEAAPVMRAPVLAAMLASPVGAAVVMLVIVGYIRWRRRPRSTANPRLRLSLAYIATTVACFPLFEYLIRQFAQPRAGIAVAGVEASGPDASVMALGPPRSTYDRPARAG